MKSSYTTISRKTRLCITKGIPNIRLTTYILTGMTLTASYFTKMGVCMRLPSTGRDTRMRYWS